MNKKHQRTLNAIFSIPVQANINWKDIETQLATYITLEHSRTCQVGKKRPKDMSLDMAKVFSFSIGKSRPVQA